MTTDHGRAALLHLAGNSERTTAPDEFEVPPKTKLEAKGDRLVLHYRDPVSSVARRQTVDAGRIVGTAPPHWQRARIAVLALEHAGTRDAKAVLSQLADGHPDILPTQQAKAALARMNGK